MLVKNENFVIQKKSKNPLNLPDFNINVILFSFSIRIFPN